MNRYLKSVPVWKFHCGQHSGCYDAHSLDIYPDLGHSNYVAKSTKSRKPNSEGNLALSNSSSQTANFAKSAFTLIREILARESHLAAGNSAGLE